MVVICRSQGMVEALREVGQAHPLIEKIVRMDMAYADIE